VLVIAAIAFGLGTAQARKKAPKLKPALPTISLRWVKRSMAWTLKMRNLSLTKSRSSWWTT